MPLQATSGAASYDAFGGGAAAVPNYIEEVFSTWLYEGNSSSSGPTISNGLDLLGKGGMVWTKSRSVSNSGHMLFDTVRGGNSLLTTSGDTSYLGGTGVDAAVTYGFNLRNFLSNGFNISNTTSAVDNQSGNTYASWTFRKQPKFFDVVTWTGDDTTRAISHNLGSVPGCIIVKATNTTSDWSVYHRSLGNNARLQLNTTAAQITPTGSWGTTDPTSTTFTVGPFAGFNASGSTYVAYLFAHNAGGFGLTGTDNVISCGSYTGTGASFGPQVDLGYEPQWVMIKAASTTGSWAMFDNMRGIQVSGPDQRLYADTSGAEATTGGNGIEINATGFRANETFTYINGSGQTYIYIAIRRGPMKVPTTGTSVYTSASRTGTAGVIPRWTAGFPVDWALRKSGVTTGGSDWQAGDRLRGAVQLKPNLTELETASSLLYNFSSITGYSSLGAAGSDTADRSWMFQRAPGFFDVVCYTGTGSSGRSVPHNLTVVPELMIVKSRSGTGVWRVYAAALNSISEGLTLQLNTTAQADFNGNFFGIPTSSSIILNDSGTETSNQSGVTYVAYLFASAPGVSKCGLYTGNGSSQTINCGFTGGARFVLVKRTNSTGNWLVVDTARGLVSAGDPTLYLNSTAAEVTGNDWIDPDSSGFIVNQTSTINANVNGGTYIFLAIA